MSIRFHRPEPVLRHGAARVDASVSPELAAQRLRDGELLEVRDVYSTGKRILGALERQLPQPPADAPFAARQSAQRAFDEAASRLLVPIAEARMALEPPQPLGFLSDLYPGLQRFSLPFVDVIELQAAWTRYKDGVYLPVIGRSLHPFYGAYTPRRTVHLELFATWLSQYEGAKRRAVDVGTGSGVLAFMLARAGFESILATDVNPNALESVHRELGRFDVRPPIELHHGDLLGDGGQQVDLVVFNPPWIRGDVGGPLDHALFFEEGLFERFFDQVCRRLTDEGRVALVFSNVLQLLRPELPHPILTELERGRLRLVQKLQRKVKPGDTPGAPRRRTKEKVEIWELARPER